MPAVGGTPRVPLASSAGTPAKQENTFIGSNDELKVLVDEVADRVNRWTAQPAWTWEPGSSASAEIANTEIRQDAMPSGTARSARRTRFAQMATKLAVEMSRCAALLIGAGRPASRKRPGRPRKRARPLAGYWKRSCRPESGLPHATAAP